MKTSKCRGSLAMLCLVMILCNCKAEKRQTTVLETFSPLAQNQFFETEKLSAKKPWDLAIYIKSNNGQDRQLLTTLEGFTGKLFQSDDGKKLLLSVKVEEPIDDCEVDFLYIDGSAGTLERLFPAMTTFQFTADDTGTAVIAEGKLVDGIFTNSNDYNGIITLYDTGKGKGVQEIDLEIPETYIYMAIGEMNYDAAENKFIILMGEMMDIYLERELYLSEDRSKIVRMEKIDYEKPIPKPPRNLEKKFSPLQEGQSFISDFNDRTGSLLVSVNGGTIPLYKANNVESVQATASGDRVFFLHREDGTKRIWKIDGERGEILWLDITTDLFSVDTKFGAFILCTIPDSSVPMVKLYHTEDFVMDYTFTPSSAGDKVVGIEYKDSPARFIVSLGQGDRVTSTEEIILK